jgi:cytochrome d ubiquinol oxidase subunit I
MELDVVLLSRLQFAFTIGFHYLFPPLTIGLGLLMVIMEGTYVVTRNRIYESMAKFWTKIFALIFAIGVASGIVMEFQFGTNWATYSRYVGDIFGAALAAEGIFAFFLESGFLAVLVFGWDRVSTGMHFFSTLMVSLGSIFSAVWIVVANSWQQTPAGFKLVEQVLPDGSTFTRAELTSFWEAVLNPSTFERLTHTLVGCMIAGGCLVLSVSAFYLLRERHADFARRSVAIALPFTLVWALLALATGDLSAKQVAAYQPAKLAAMEGQFKTEANAPLHVFGIPDVENETIRFGVALPGMLSWLVHGDVNAEVTGLNAFPVEDRPPVGIVFQSFHIMVGLGMVFIAVTVVGCLLLWLGKLWSQKWLLRVFVVLIIGPMLANQLGWITAEVGRQPWIVHPTYNEVESGFTPIGGLRTVSAVSQAVDANEVLISIILFGLIYAMLFAAWIFVLDHKIKAGPESPAQLEAAAARRQDGWVATAGARAGAGGPSLTDDPLADAPTEKE